MKEVPLPAIKDTWEMALKVWWAFSWRVLVSLAFGAAALGFFVKFGPEYFHIKKSAAIVSASVAGAVYFIFITVLFIKSILNRRFKGFSVVIIKTK